MSKYEVPKIKYRGALEITDLLDISDCKPIGQIIAEELDQAIAKDIVEVMKKYFPDTQLDEKKVLHLAKMLIESEDK